MYYLLHYYKYFIIAIGAVLILISLGRLISGRSFSAIRSSGKQGHPFRWRWWLTLLTIVALLVNGIVSVLLEHYYGSADISLNYTEASQGLNPNETRFNQADILSEEVLERAIEKGALPVSAENLRKTLTVFPKQGGGTTEETYFISTQYIIEYEGNAKTALLNGSRVVSLVAEAYKEGFVSEYELNDTALNMDFSKLDDLEYLDVCENLQTDGNRIAYYMQQMSNEASTFQSSTTGETFASISSEAFDAVDVMVERLRAYVLENNIAKRRTDYISRLSFQNVFTYFDAVKEESKENNNLAAIERYANDMARIVLVPTYDLNEQFYMSQTRIGVDDFSKEAETRAENKNTLLADIASNDRSITIYSSKDGAVDGTDAKAEELIGQIEKELERLSESARAALSEYNEQKTNEYMTITAASRTDLLFRIIKRTVVYTLYLVIAAYLYTVVRKLTTKGRSEKEDEVKA